MDQNVFLSRGEKDQGIKNKSELAAVWHKVGLVLVNVCFWWRRQILVVRYSNWFLNIRNKFSRNFYNFFSKRIINKCFIWNDIYFMKCERSWRYKWRLQFFIFFIIKLFPPAILLSCPEVPATQPQILFDCSEEFSIK